MKKIISIFLLLCAISLLTGTFVASILKHLNYTQQESVNGIIPNSAVSNTDKEIMSPSASYNRHMEKGSFRVDKVHTFFESSLRNGDVLIEEYLQAYIEVCKYLDTFGAVFGMVVSDVKEKIGILYTYLDDAIIQNHYESVEMMMKYEMEKDLTVNKKRPSGCRTLLRLHRALDFISLFMEHLSTSPLEDKGSTIAAKCYDETLAHYHPWLIRKAATVGFYTLGSVHDLLKKMGDFKPDEYRSKMKEFVGVARLNYRVVQKLYEDNALLDLP